MGASSRRRLVGSTLGALSIGSAALMCAVPHGMARLYAFPESAALLRLLAVRDVWVGVRLLSGDRVGGLARCGSDLFDAALMVGNARRQQRALRTIKGRLLAALLSASGALYAAGGEGVTR